VGRLILITGGRGAGKTRFCDFVARRMRLRGCEVAGLLSPARFEGGQKIGIDALDLRSLTRRHFANRPGPAGAALVRTEGWVFADAVLAWGDECLRQAVPCDVLIVDELGPLEFLRSQGWIAGLGALDSRQYRLALAVIRPELLDLAQARWPDSGVLTIGG